MKISILPMLKGQEARRGPEWDLLDLEAELSGCSLGLMMQGGNARPRSVAVLVLALSSTRTTVLR
jgi:hypothetical protein